MAKYIELAPQLVRLYRLNLDCKEVIKKFLLTAVTADVVERKRGKWVGVKIGNGDTRYTCSECGVSYECDSRDLWEFNFCPKCGADMGVKE